MIRLFLDQSFPINAMHYNAREYMHSWQGRVWKRLWDAKKSNPPKKEKKPLSFAISNANVLTQTIHFFGTRFFWLSFSTLWIVYIFIFCYSNGLHLTVIMNSLPFFHFWEIYFVFGRMVTATTTAATTTNSDANHSICGYFWTQIMTFHENTDAVWYTRNI